MVRMIWLDGRLQEAGQARIDPSDRGLLLGDGVFETLRAVGGRPRHLGRHLARLRDGAATIGLAIPWTDDDIEGGMRAVLDASGPDDAVLRLTLTRGPGERGLLPPADPRPTLLIVVGRLPGAAPPARAIVARCTRRNEHSPLSRIKSLNYLDGILARQEAAGRGADEAILLNTAGWVAEASAGTLFIERGRSLVTPPIEDGALPGIARALILAAGLASEDRLSMADLKSAPAGFISSSLGVRPLAEIEGRALPPPNTVEDVRKAVE